MGKLLTIILGAIVILIGITFLADLLGALISIVLSVSFLIIVVGGAFLILRKILRG